MLAKLLREYSKVKLINLPSQYDEPKQTKLKEFDIAFSKINSDNFDELNDITYEDVLKDQLYLFPETGINFIVRLDKIFKSEQKINKIAGESGIYDFPAFIANVEFKPSKSSLNTFSKYISHHDVLNDMLTPLALMLDEISDTRTDKDFVFIKNRYGKDKLEYYLKTTKRDFIAVYGLGFNVILEK